MFLSYFNFIFPLSSSEYDVFISIWVEFISFNLDCVFKQLHFYCYSDDEAIKLIEAESLSSNKKDNAKFQQTDTGSILF